MAAFLFPNETYSFDRLEVIPDSQDEAVEFTLSLYFARATWLTLGSLPTTSQDPDETENTQSVWYITESHLRQVTQGIQVVYSKWCMTYSKFCPPPLGSKYPYPNVYPYVTAGISGVRDGKFVRTQQSPIGSDLGILTSSRNYILVLD